MRSSSSDVGVFRLSGLDNPGIAVVIVKGQAGMQGNERSLRKAVLRRIADDTDTVGAR